MAFALADVPSSRLASPAYPPERSGVAEGELNAGCKSVAALIDVDPTDPIRPQSDPTLLTLHDPAIPSRRLRRAANDLGPVLEDELRRGDAR